MEFSKPSLQTLITRIQSDIASRLGIQLPMKKASVLSSLSFAMAGAVYLLYGTIEYWVREWFIDTAKGKNLDRLAGCFGMKRRGRTQATGAIRIDGAPGKIIQKDAVFSRPDGATYTLLADATIQDSGFTFAKIIATDTGPIGNLASSHILSTRLTLITSISDVKREAVVLDAGIMGGFEEEDDDTLRSRLLRRLRHPGQGGSETDYKHWAQEVPGVGNVWVEPQPKSFAINISFLTTDADHVIPSPDFGKQVEDTLKLKKPLGTRVSYRRLELVVVLIEVQLPTQNGSQAALEKAFKLFFMRKVAPGERIPLVRLT
jgi:uncharacterized phage protein gp47/JayE